MEIKSNFEQQQQKQNGHVKRSAVWDCGSALYDSYELKSLEQHLGSAIATRTMSMPRLPTREHPSPAASAATAAAAAIPDVIAKPSKTAASSRLSRSVQKMVRAVLRLRLPRMARPPTRHYAATNPWFTTGGLTTIPEACEKGFEWPPKPADVGPELRKAASERYTGKVSVFR